MLYDGPLLPHPVLTVERYCKWYDLYLVLPDGTVRGVGAYPYDDFAVGETAMGDHCWNPAVVQRVAAHERWIVDDLSMELIAGRWVIEHLNLF